MTSFSFGVRHNEQHPDSEAGQPKRPEAETAAMRVFCCNDIYYRLADVALMCVKEPQELQGIAEECRNRTTYRGEQISDFVSRFGYANDMLSVSMPIAGIETEFFTETFTMALAAFSAFESNSQINNVALDSLFALTQSRVHRHESVPFVLDLVPAYTSVMPVMSVPPGSAMPA